MEFQIPDSYSWNAARCWNCNPASKLDCEKCLRLTKDELNYVYNSDRISET